MQEIQDFIGKHLDVNKLCKACKKESVDINKGECCINCYKELLIRQILRKC